MREITKRQYSGEFKERAREDYLNSDKTYEELSGKYEVNVSILSKWVGIYREHGAQGFEKQPRKTTKRTCKYRDTESIFQHWGGYSSKNTAIFQQTVM